jgi:GNAT superfamily N-acetyltransferase
MEPLDEDDVIIRKCSEFEVDSVCKIINNAAQAYKGVIPDDRWHDPYMSRAELGQELLDGVVFWGAVDDHVLVGVMGVQDKDDVALIRHAYVRGDRTNSGIGSRLLRFIESAIDKPILVGTWADATWAIAFYQKNGYRLVSGREKDRLLRKYWMISERQIETSVVLNQTAPKRDVSNE